MINLFNVNKKYLQRIIRIRKRLQNEKEPLTFDPLEV